MITHYISFRSPLLVRKLVNGRRITRDHIHARVVEQVEGARNGNPNYLVDELTRMFVDINDFQVATKKIVGGELLIDLFYPL